MLAPELDETYVDELLRRQDALQAEAERVVAELELGSVLGRAGSVTQLGSSVTGLMVWRDLDFSIVGPDIRMDRVLDALQPLMYQPGVTRMTYRNETGFRSPSGLPNDQRYYFVLHYEAAGGSEWKIDLSFWLVNRPRNEADRQRLLVGRLSNETRLAILWIKDVWHQLPSYPYVVGGTDIYDAVLNHDVRTPDEFGNYLQRRGLPLR
jgi:hypothetical protein